ncbi:MAG: conjugal transfer protein TraL [Desulfocapsaceae bacterium]|nr:conjugal transfer protein TraL [Desulfocapsaceae bacterium]
MSTIHFVLQGKGGVGKSLVASLLYQYLQKKDVPVFGIDTDPVNSTLKGYKELNVEQLDIMNGDDIDPRRFDRLIDSIFQKPEDTHIIIDNGASSFVPLCSYLKESDALNFLQEENHRTLLHTIMTGGQAIVDTSTGLKSLAESFPNAPIIVWKNSYFGEIAINGKVFEEFTIYQLHQDKFRSIIQIPIRKQTTFGKDLEELFARRETFEAAINSSLPVMTRQRLKTFWRDVQEAIDLAQLV